MPYARVSQTFDLLDFLRRLKMVNFMNGDK